MIPTSYLFKDLYHDRWGTPLNPTLGNTLADMPAAIPEPLVRHRARRPTAWSFIIPIDRRLR